MDKIKLQKLADYEFPYDQHSMDNLDLPYESALGYRDSKDMTTLSKTNMMAVKMYDEERGDFWCHLPYTLFEHHYIIDEKYEEQEQSLEDYEKEFDKTLIEVGVKELKKEYETKLLKDNPIFENNINSIKAENQNDKLQHCVWEYGGWWAFNYQDYLDNPAKVKVVNEAGGYHYSDLTNEQRAMATCIDRKFLPNMEDK